MHQNYVRIVVEDSQLQQDTDSHFHEALLHWQELNLAPAFLKFARDADPLSASMPLLLHNWKEIVELWFGALEESDDEGLRAILEYVRSYPFSSHLSWTRRVQSLSKARTRPADHHLPGIPPRPQATAPTPSPLPVCRGSDGSPRDVLRAVQVRPRAVRRRRTLAASLEGILRRSSSMPPGGPTSYGRGLGCDPSTTQSIPEGRRGETHRIERDVQSERRVCMDLRDRLQGAHPSADRCQYPVTSSPVRLANPPHGHVKSGRPSRSALPRHRLPGRGVYPPPSRLHRAHSSLQERGPVLTCLGCGREAI